MSRILIVDDEPRILLLLQSLLKANGYEVESARDGASALDIVRKGEIDITITDLRMSPMDGMTLFKEIKKIAPDMPVVFLTDSDAYAVEAFSVKALHYILKPMTEPDLKECLNRLEERPGARQRVHIISSSGTRQMLYADEIQYAQSDAHYYDLHLKDGTVIKVRMTQKEIRNTLGDSFLLVSRGLVVNLEFIRQLGPKSCMLKDGREILLSRGNVEEIHSAYAAYVFSRLSKRDGTSPERVK